MLWKTEILSGVQMLKKQIMIVRYVRYWDPHCISLFARKYLSLQVMTFLLSRLIITSDYPCKKTVLERSNKIVFHLYGKIKLLFALPCLPFYKFKAVGRGIPKRAKVKQLGRVFSMKGNKKENPGCQSRYNKKIVICNMCKRWQQYIDRVRLNYHL